MTCTPGQLEIEMGGKPRSCKHNPSRDIAYLRSDASVRLVEGELLRAQGPHHGVEDTELQRRQGTDHDATGPQALRAQLHDARLLGDVHHALRDRAVATPC